MQHVSVIDKCSVKVKLSLDLIKHHAMKMYGEVKVYVHHSYFSNRWRRVVSFKPLSLYPQGNSPWYPLYVRLSEPKSSSGRYGEVNALYV
jgi:hypothetical protein